MTISAEKQWSKPPALLAAHIQNLIITLTGVKDPYKEAKYLSNEEALKFYSDMKTLMSKHSDPLLAVTSLGIVSSIFISSFSSKFFFLSGNQLFSSELKIFQQK